MLVPVQDFHNTLIKMVILYFSRRLFKAFHRRKQFLKDDMKGADQKLLDMKKDLMTAEHMRDVYDLMKHYKKDSVSKPEMIKHDIKVKVYIHEPCREKTCQRTRSNTKRTVQPQKMARGLKFRI